MTMQNVRDRLDIKLNDQTAAELSRRPIQYETGFTLLPGTLHHQGARTRQRDRAHRHVPDELRHSQPQSGRPHACRSAPSSSAASACRSASAVYSVKKSGDAVNPLVYDGQKLMPSVTRVFSRGRDLYVFLQAYEPGRPAAAAGRIRDFLPGRGEGVRNRAAGGDRADVDSKTKARPVRFSVPLENLPPGRYECQVTVLQPGASRAAFWRAPVVVVP